MASTSRRDIWESLSALLACQWAYSAAMPIRVANSGGRHKIVCGASLPEQ
jgi:hypothetical protein